MRRDVRNWIASCDVCLKRKCTKHKHRHSLTKCKPSHPFWKVSLDVIGPHPECQGNQYILRLGAQFMKWYEAVTLPNQETKTVSRAFVEHWMVRFGCPVNLHSDQGLHKLYVIFFIVFAVNYEFRRNQQNRTTHKETRWLKEKTENKKNASPNT